jgi:hypothetical protein
MDKRKKVLIKDISLQCKSEKEPTFPEIYCCFQEEIGVARRPLSFHKQNWIPWKSVPSQYSISHLDEKPVCLYYDIFGPFIRIG